MNERKRQEHTAWRLSDLPRRYHFVCSDGSTFSALAISESAAFRVLNAERPGVVATPDGVTYCPAPPVARRRSAHDATCSCHMRMAD